MDGVPLDALVQILTWPLSAFSDQSKGKMHNRAVPSTKIMPHQRCQPIGDEQIGHSRRLGRRKNGQCTKQIHAYVVAMCLPVLA